MNKDIYYNLDKILSYNAFLNFIVGSRGIGKTYSTSKFVTKQFLKKNCQFVYIRRFKSELKEGLDDFYDSLIKNDEFKKHKFSRKGNELLIDDKVVGYGLTLTQAQTIKGSNFPNVKYIIFDEFLIEEDGHHFYLKNEVKMFLSMIESIARTRDVIVFCLGNSTSIYNPYFLFFNIEQPYNSDIKLFKNGLILIQVIENIKYREFKKQTRFGQLTSGTDYEQFALYLNFGPSLKSIIPPIALFSSSKYLPSLRSYLIGDLGSKLQPQNKTLIANKHTTKREYFFIIKASLIRIACSLYHFFYMFQSFSITILV